MAGYSPAARRFKARPLANFAQGPYVGPKETALDEHRARITKDGIRIYEDADFRRHAHGGRIAAEILDAVAPLVVPGTTTAVIDDFITEEIKRRGVTSATIGYKGYRHASCISVNHVVCHGIPGPKVLMDGDILNIDVTVIVDGWYGDTSRMYVAGHAGPQGRTVDRGDPRRPDARHRCGQAGQHLRRHRPCDPVLRRGAAHVRRPRLLRPRPWPGVPRARRTCCTTAGPAPGRCWRKACSSPSSRW
jgi:hypothetical protein